VCIVAEGNRAGTDPDRSYTQLLVRADSGIRDLRDLEGKTIAINSLNNVGPLSINTAVAQHGGDISKLHYIEIPFPEMNLALKGRRVDAIWQTEPFLTQARSQLKVCNVSSTLIDTKPDYTVSAYFTSRKYAQQNPDMVRRFVEGMNRSLTYSQAHPDEVRSLVPTYTKIPANAAKRILLSHWTPDIGKDSLALTIKLAKRYGYLEKAPSVAEMLCPSR
jgi:NitT/TauT family transport system substrate-binding protein